VYESSKVSARFSVPTVIWANDSLWKQKHVSERKKRKRIRII